MAIIDPDGLFNGDRLAKCSDRARLMWPYYFLASNGYGRLELNYRRLVAKAFSTFKEPPTEREFMELIAEYHQNFLLFLYSHNGDVWGQWDTGKKYLPQYQTAKDKLSPEPPAEQLAQFIASYHDSKKPSESFQNLPQLLHEISYGVGVGIGIGEGIGDGISPHFLSKNEPAELVEPDNLQPEKEESMSAQKKITALSSRILGVKAETWDSTWAEVKGLVDAFGQREVCAAFEEWAATKRGLVLDKPVTEFLKIAHGVLAGIIDISVSAEVEDLIDSLVAVTDGEVLFSDQEQLVVSQYLKQWSAEEILAAYRRFYTRIENNPYKLANAAKDFCGAPGGQMLRNMKKSAIQTAKTVEAMDAARLQQKAQVAEELMEIEAEEAEEAALLAEDGDNPFEEESN